MRKKAILGCAQRIWRTVHGALSKHVKAEPMPAFQLQLLGAFGFGCAVMPELSQERVRRPAGAFASHEHDGLQQSM